jgi:hypothetical protein
VPLASRNERNLFNEGPGHHAPLVQIAPNDVVYVHQSRTSVAGFVKTPFHEDPPGQYARWRSDGTPIDTVPDPFWSVDPPVISLRPNPAPGSAMQVPFTAGHVWTLSPLGYFVTGLPIDRGGEYSIELRLPPVVSTGLARWRDGDPVRSIRVPYVQAAVDAAERADWERVYSAAIAGRNNPDWRWNGPPIPTAKPPYNGIWVDGEGRIWVSLHTAARRSAHPTDVPEGIWSAGLRWPEEQVFDVIEPTGRYTGKVRALEKIIPQAARGDRLWAIVPGDWGQITVKRYRIDWGGSLRCSSLNI